MKEVGEDINRFKDENYTIYNFQNEIFVECPKCSKRAILKKETPNASWWSERILSCPNCFYSQKGCKETFKVELKCNCANCAAEINVTIPHVNEKKKK